MLLLQMGPKVSRRHYVLHIYLIAMSEKIVLTVMQKPQPLQFSASRAVSSSSKSQSGDTLY